MAYPRQDFYHGQQPEEQGSVYITFHESENGQQSSVTHDYPRTYAYHGQENGRQITPAFVYQGRDPGRMFHPNYINAGSSDGITHSYQPSHPPFSNHHGGVENIEMTASRSHKTAFTNEHYNYSTPEIQDDHLSSEPITQSNLSQQSLNYNYEGAAADSKPQSEDHSENALKKHYWRLFGKLQKPKYKFTIEDEFSRPDALGRKHEGLYEDKFPLCETGNYEELVVQCSDGVFNNRDGGSTWARGTIRNVGPLHLKVAARVFAHLKDPDAPFHRWTREEKSIFYRKLPITLLSLLVMSIIPRLTQGEARNGGNYDPFVYRCYTSAKTYHNRIEEGSGPFRRIEQIEHDFSGDDRRSHRISGFGLVSATESNRVEGPPIPDDLAVREIQDHEDGKMKRLLMPRYLCKISSRRPGFRLKEVKRMLEMEVPRPSGSNKVSTSKKECPKYIFIAYLSKHFDEPNTTSRKPNPSLHKLAQQATRDAGCEFYWVGEQCLEWKETTAADGSTGKYCPDVWTISDIIRGAAKVIIALPNDAKKTADTQNSETRSLTSEVSENTHKSSNFHQRYLQEFSSRLWTYPEILLSPGRQVTVYLASFGSELCEYEEVDKALFPANYLDQNDALVSRQLFDHYLGSQLLSGLELTILALQCLSSRQYEGEKQYLAGDYSYALMGLLRRRPVVDPTDTPFLAFARLSLANHNEQLLERLICTLPTDPKQKWHCMDDAYGAFLWDIVPYIQVAGIGVWHADPKEKFDMNHDELDPEDVAIIDGCYGALIHWDQFQPVLHARRDTSARRIARIIFRLNIVYPIIGIACIASYASSKKASTSSSLVDIPRDPINNATLLAVGIIFLITFFVVFIFSPFIVRHLYDGKIWGTQAWFFGFEGYMPIEEIEQLIFGAYLGRFKWSHGGSPLSLIEVDKLSGIVSTPDPTENSETAKLVEKAKSSKPGDRRIFTLVDTGSMEVTLFEAERPPVALLICASEGGMQRAIGCSFDWTTETLYRETVLRVPTYLLSKLPRMSRVKFGIKRPNEPVVLNTKDGGAPKLAKLDLSDLDIFTPRE